LLFISGFLFNSCDNDFEVDTSSNANQHSHDSNLKVSKVYFDEFKDNTDLLNKISKSTGNNTSVQNQKLVHSADDSFYIDTDYAYFIEDENGKHSYTFQINRQNSPYPLENLIVAQNDSLAYNVYIAQYNINATEFTQLSNGQHPNISDKIIITPISNSVIDVNTLLSRDSGEGMCWTETVIPGNTCPGDEHHTLGDVLGGAVCPYFSAGTFTLFVTHIIYTYGPCGEDGGGGGDSGDGEGPSGPGNTGGGSGNITTTPVVTPPVMVVPCNELKKISDKPQFKAKMLTLKVNISGTKEKGFIIRDKEGDDAFSSIIEGDNDGTIKFPYPNSTSAETAIYYSSIATAHNHITTRKDQIGIFTPEDLQSLKFNGEVETNPLNPNKSRAPFKSAIFVITNKGLFALKINDLSKLQSFYNWFGNMSPLDKEAYLLSAFSNPKIHNITPKSTRIELITGFLRFIDDLDIGVDLYEANATTFSGWNKLDLIDNNGVFTFSQTPCN
jgi:hypothetical protein